MTMAPEPGMRIVWILARFIDTFHQLEKLTKDNMRLLWTRRRLGMELHTKNRFVLHPQTFERVIVQAFVGNFHFSFIQVSFSDTIIMILRGDENFPSW